MHRRTASSRMHSPPMVRRPRGPSPPPLVRKSPVSSSSSALRKRLIEGLQSCCCQRRRAQTTIEIETAQPLHQRAVPEAFLQSPTSATLPSFGGVMGGDIGQTFGGSSSASAVPVFGARARSTSKSGPSSVLIPGLESKKPTRPLSRPRMSTTTPEAFPFSAAFQEFFTQEAQELGEFVRMRSVTPPPRDFVNRALRGEMADANTLLNFNTPSTKAREDQLSSPQEEECRNVPSEALHVESANSQMEPRNSMDAGREQHQDDQVSDATIASLRRTTASIREKSPCFGESEETTRAAEDQPLERSPGKGEGRTQRSLQYQALETLVRPARQVPRVRRHIRANSRSRHVLAANGRASRSSLGRSGLHDEGRSLANAAPPPPSATRRRSRGNVPNLSSQSDSRSLARRSQSCSGLAASDNSYSPLSAAIPAPEKSDSKQKDVVALSLPEANAIADESGEAATEVCEDTALRQASEEKPASPKQNRSETARTELAEPKSKGKGKGKAPPPPPKGLAAKPKPKAASSATKSRALSEGPWYHGRPLYWRELPGASEGSHSIFDTSANGDRCARLPGFGFDWDECDELFGNREEILDACSRRKTAPEIVTQGGVIDEPLICVLSQRQATSCSIILRAFDNLGRISESLQNLEFESLNEDLAGRLKELVDSVEDKHVKQLREMSEQISSCHASCKPAPNLRNIERQLLPLFDIDRVEAHVRLAQINYAIEAERNRICSASEALAKASKDIRNSKALKDFVDAAVSLRDYVQHGPEAFKAREIPARVMDIGSLLSGMREFKAVGPDSKKVSLLLFFARSLLRMRPDFDVELVRELPGLVDNRSLTSSGDSPWPALHDGLNQLRAQAAFAKSELAEHGGAYGDSGAKRLHTLIEALENANGEATETMVSTASALEELGRYFGVPGARDPVDKAASVSRKDPSGIRVLCQVAALLAGFCQTCAQVRELDSDGKKTRSISPRFRKVR